MLQKCGKERENLLGNSPLLATVLSQALWNWEINSAGASESFSNKIQLSTLLDIILGRDTTYRTQVLHNYWDALNLSGTGSIMGTLSGIKYVGLLFIFLVLLYCIHLLCKRVAFVDSKRMNVILGFSAVTLVGYVAGLCVMYMFKFSEYEALTLASMNRYINIVFVGVWILILLLFSQLSTLMKSSFDVEICLILIIMLFSPVQYFGRFVRGDYISDAQWYREPYEDLRQQIQENCDRDDRIYLVTVEKVVGLNFHICKFNSRPNVISGYWRIGTSSDIWTEEMTAESRKKLVDNYDYVALYEINDYFLEHFDELFTAQGDITANTLYRVNRECGVLEKCDSK